jgi:phosphopantothenate---cysteine ligase (ATP)
MPFHRVLEEDINGRTIDQHNFLDRLWNDSGSYEDRIIHASRDLKLYRDRLILLEFSSVQHYLYLLYHIVLGVDRFRSRVLVLLSAAVSDFYLPKCHLSEHKLSSSSGLLNLSLRPVPRLLAFLKSKCPLASFVSFKLETDENLLIHNARLAMIHVGHNLVVGNVLEQRHKKIYIVREHDFHVLTNNSPSESLDALELQLANVLMDYHRNNRTD